MLRRMEEQIYFKEATPSKTPRRCIVKYNQRTGKAPKNFLEKMKTSVLFQQSLKLEVCFCISCISTILFIVYSDSFVSDLIFGCEVIFVDQNVGQ